MSTINKDFVVTGGLTVPGDAKFGNDIDVKSLVATEGLLANNINIRNNINTFSFNANVSQTYTSNSYFINAVQTTTFAIIASEASFNSVTSNNITVNTINAINVFSTDVYSSRATLSGTPYGIRMKTYPLGNTSGVGVLHHIDTQSYYILLTNNNDAHGSHNGLRPFYIDLLSGNVYLNQDTTAKTLFANTFNANAAGISNVTSNNIFSGNANITNLSGGNLAYTNATIGYVNSNTLNTLLVISDAASIQYLEVQNAKINGTLNSISLATFANVNINVANVNTTVANTINVKTLSGNVVNGNTSIFNSGSFITVGANSVTTNILVSPQINATSVGVSGTMIVNNIVVTGNSTMTFTPGQMLRSYREYVNSGGVSGTYVIDLLDSNIFNLTLSANTTFVINSATLPAAGVAASWTMILKQGNPNSRITFPSGTLWSEGVAPVPSTGLNQTDVFTFMVIGGGSIFGAHSFANVA